MRLAPIYIVWLMASEAIDSPFYNYLPAVCWVCIGIFMPASRTIRYSNLDAPRIMLDPKKDHRAAMVGGVSMVIAGCLAFVIVIQTGGSELGFIAASLMGGVAVLVLYGYCRMVCSSWW